MNIPTRLLVLQRLTTLLEGIEVTFDGGAPISLVGRVVRGRNIIGDETEAPFLSMLDAPRPDTPEYAGANQMRKDDWTILISGIAPDNKANPSDNGFWFVAAVEERLGLVTAIHKTRGTPLYPEHYMLGAGGEDLITKLEVAPPVVRQPDDKLSSSAFFFLPIRVGIAGAVGKPYTSVG